jgi:CheY-like chemotaxis protein
MEGYQVVVAVSGEEALNLFKHNKPDLVLCDYLLKDMDGADLCARLSRHPLVSGTPMVLVTAMPLARVRGIEQYTAVVEKPFDVTDLLDVISSALTMSGAKREVMYSVSGS